MDIRKEWVCAVIDERYSTAKYLEPDLPKVDRPKEPDNRDSSSIIKGEIIVNDIL